MTVRVANGPIVPNPLQTIVMEYFLYYSQIRTDWRPSCDDEELVVEHGS